MRRPLLVALPLALLAAGAFAFAALGGDGPRGVDATAANARTAHAASVHYAVAVTLNVRRQPMTLHIVGGSSRAGLAVRLRLDDLKLSDGSKLAGATAAVRLSTPFVYEQAPGVSAQLGKVRWLRLSTVGLSSRSQIMSHVHALTPAPLLRVVGESKLRPTGAPGAFAGTAAYDDPIVETALASLGGGLQFRSLRVAVQVGRDGLVHRIRIDGRTADGTTTLRVRARLYGFGRPVKIVPPKPGTFMDEHLRQLQA